MIFLIQIYLQLTNSSRKRPKQIQGFVDSWLSGPQFKSWLTKKIGTGKKAQPFCKTCSKFVTCSKTGLKRHQTSAYHKRCHDSSIGSTSTIPSLFNQSKIRDGTSSMEIKICIFISEHNLPISIADAFVEFLRSLFPNDDVLRKVRLGKQKATNVIRQVIGFDYLYEAVSALQSHRFSIVIDETTDLSSVKQFAVLATYFDMHSFESKYFLLDLVELVDGTANGIYLATKQVFLELHIPMENIIGYSSDTTNVMFGEHNSVAQL